MNILKKIFNFLDSKNKVQIYVLIFLSLIGMILETLGIGMVLPLLIMLTKSNSFPAEIKYIIDFLGINISDPNSIIIILLSMVGYFFVKLLFLLYLSFKQNSFVYKLQSQLSTLLFTGYLKSPYTFHLQHNSTELIRNVVVEVGKFTGAMSALLVFVTEIFVLIGILILLLFIEPLGAIISLLTLGSCALFFDRTSKKYLKNWGFVRQYNEGVRLKNLNQALNAYKEIKISGTESIFTSKFETNSLKVSDMEIRSIVLSSSPRLGLEFLAVVGVFIVISILLSQGNSFSEIVPKIGIFGVAAFRIMPSIYRLINTGQVVRYHLSVIMMLEQEFNYFKQLKIKKNKKVIKINEIEINNVSFKYKGNKEFTLKDLNFKLKNKEFVGIIGASGTGKSTFISIILGLLKPNKGIIKNNNKNIHHNIVDWQNVIGYVPQDVYLIDDSIENNIAFGLKPYEIDEQKLKEAIEFASLSNFLNELPNGLKTIVGEKGVLISGGQKQRIGLARAVYNKPQLLILDEATNALDSKTEKSIIRNIKKLPFEPIIVMITHREKSLKLCDSVYEFYDGIMKKKYERGNTVD